MRASIIGGLLLVLNQACWAQGLSVEDRACITKAAGKLPKVVTIEQSRVVPQAEDKGQHERGLYHVKVEIDASVAGQTSTYVFNCIHTGEMTVVQPLGSAEDILAASWRRANEMTLAASRCSPRSFAPHQQT